MHQIIWVGFFPKKKTYFFLSPWKKVGKKTEKNWKKLKKMEKTGPKLQI